ncbi:hypothetical protein G9Q38_14310 [Pusillimonas sp. DMV24BSW_D]|uniref:hypothetical protein n=1 Tax=Neopusillimonas aestuarii TaxID=2716226 RepID=UPI001407EF0A|nr:hypothetical protein [Pusillimonas sp. DMV24BSW_D]QIM50239.1 hypothetical protein G9Q38_14310 [Pusillimonas sp. DMV24BSW_D]
MDKNPWDTLGWRALSRESKLVRHLLGSGVTALGRANYADQTGEYYTAFFGLSVGVERLAKLILVADYALSNRGRLPTQSEVKKYGHNIKSLLMLISVIAEKHSIKLQYSKPTTIISEKIVECLDAFADASRGRYANFTALGDPNIEGQFEPIRKWWTEVAELILQEHYYGKKKAQIRVASNAKIVDAMIGNFSAVLHFDEAGGVMSDVISASVRTGQTKYVQKYGRYHALTVIRWMSDIFCELCRKACYEFQIVEFFGHHELFWTYTVDDTFLKNRKVWPLS